MPSMSIKNLDPELYEKLKRLAEAHKRSLNKEVIRILELAVKDYK